MSLNYLSRPGKPNLAYVHTPGHGPLVMFLGGFKSDMQGTKATYLEARAKARGQAFLRFDYSGHGQSKGAFKEGTIGTWKEDAGAVLSHIVKEPAVLVGSSMGGWISLLLMLEHPEMIKALVGIAAAPDFTEGIRTGLTLAQKQKIEEDGFLEEPSDYGESYIFTRALLEDGKSQRLLNRRHTSSAPMHLIQGKLDSEVDWHTPERIKAAFPDAVVDITLIDEGDHRLSRPQDLQIIDNAIEKLSG